MFGGNKYQCVFVRWQGGGLFDAYVFVRWQGGGLFDAYEYNGKTYNLNKNFATKIK